MLLFFILIVDANTYNKIKYRGGDDADNKDDVNKGKEEVATRTWIKRTNTAMKVRGVIPRAA